MKLRSYRGALLATLLTVSSCAVASPPNPFKIPEANIKAKVKVVALAPLNLGSEFEDPQSIQTKFESLIETKLREGGFTVVPSKEYAAIWKQMTETLGGVFDPISGKRDEAKLKMVREHTVRELASKNRADAVLYSGMGAVKANFNAGRAKWHGTAEYIVTGGFWGALAAGNTYGTIPAVSLFVSLTDLNGVDMYVNAGGVQALSKLSGRNFTTVPRHELFTDEDRNRHALNIALNPLLGKPTPEEDPQPATPTAR